MDEALGIRHRVGAVRVDGDLDLRPERLARRLDAGRRDMRRAVHGADAHLHRLEAALGDIGLELVADLVGGRPAARGIGRHAVELAAAEQLPDRLAEMLAQNVPQRDVDRADGGDRHAAARDLRHGMALARGETGARAVVEHLPDRADVAGMAADQQRPDLVVEHVDQRAIVAGTAGGVLALAPADQSVIGLDAQDGRVEGAHLPEIAAVLAFRRDGYANPPCVTVLDAHWRPLPFRALAEGRTAVDRAPT